MLKALQLYTHTHTHTHTDALDKNKNKKIYERDIYENASNCCAEIKKEYQIKLNVVGVGVPKGITDLYSHVRSNNSEMLDDPFIKQKHTNKPLSNNQKSNIKFPTSNSAITLVALVITVIVLLILAGVTLNMLIGENGIIAKAQLAKEKTNEAQQVEEEQLKNLEKYLNGNTSNLPENTSDTEAGTIVKTPENWNTKTARYISTSNGVEITGQTEVATVYAVATGNGETVPVPYEFYYVGGTKSSGVVISDNPNDKDKYKGQEDVGKDLQGNQFVWIPCSASEYTKRDWGYSDNSWDNTTLASEKTQIQKYGGFYIGRYEAGTSEVELTSGKKIGDEQLSASAWKNSSYIVGNTTKSSKPTSKANEIPYYYSDLNTAVQMSEKMYNTNYVNSGLITGTQWDLMINFMSNETDKSIENAGNSEKYKDLKANCDWGNYNNTTLSNCTGKYCIASASSTTAWEDNTTGSNRQSTYVILTTGSTEEVKKKNLYDVAGNLWEWTQESVSSSSYYMIRGGSFWSAYASNPACQRANTTDSNANATFGFRVVLYIK